MSRDTRDNNVVSEDLSINPPVLFLAYSTVECWIPRVTNHWDKFNTGFKFSTGLNSANSNANTIINDCLVEICLITVEYNVLYTGFIFLGFVFVFNGSGSSLKSAYGSGFSRIFFILSEMLNTFFSYYYWIVQKYCGFEKKEQNLSLIAKVANWVMSFQIEYCSCIE